MPGTGLAAPNRVALGENTRMLVGGLSGVDYSVLALDGVSNLFVVNLIRFVSGNIDIGGSVLDVTDNLSFGFNENSRGPKNATMVADCFWRAADNPFAFPPNFVELEETPRLIMWPDILNAPSAIFKFPIGFCEGFSVTLAGTADVRFNLRLRSQKWYYTPSRPDPAGVWA